MSALLGKAIRHKTAPHYIGPAGRLLDGILYIISTNMLFDKAVTFCFEKFKKKDVILVDG